MTEDKHHSLFYRYISAMCRDSCQAAGKSAGTCRRRIRPSLRTHNWSSVADIRLGEKLSVSWIDLEDVDSDEMTCASAAPTNGAAMFARGEGLCAGEDFLAFTCTIGGHARLGQVFTYLPS